jgi:uncharacterized RDD family membrane protein YckC
MTDQVSSGAVSSERAGFWTRFGGGILDGIILAIPGVPLQIALKGVGSALSLLIGLAYFTILVGREQGRTVGMGAMGLRVISASGGGSIGSGRAFIRWIGGYLSTVFLGLWFLWMLWDKEKQCWHDKMAGDFVIHSE